VGGRESSPSQTAAAAPVLSGLIDRIEAQVAAAEVEAQAQPVLLKERFAKRMAELVDRGGDINERIVQEAAVMAGRADVREELDRLTSHVQAARTLLVADGSVGRRRGSGGELRPSPAPWEYRARPGRT